MEVYMSTDCHNVTQQCCRGFFDSI